MSFPIQVAGMVEQGGVVPDCATSGAVYGSDGYENDTYLYDDDIGSGWYMPWSSSVAFFWKCGGDLDEVPYKLARTITGTDVFNNTYEFWLYRRAKYSMGDWGTAIEHDFPYVAGTTYLMDFKNYDYYWHVEEYSP